MAARREHRSVERRFALDEAREHLDDDRADADRLERVRRLANLEGAPAAFRAWLTTVVRFTAWEHMRFGESFLHTVDSDGLVRTVVRCIEQGERACDCYNEDDHPLDDVLPNPTARFPFLAAALDDPSPLWRARAARQLAGHAPSEAALGEALARVRSDRSAVVRAWAAFRPARRTPRGRRAADVVIDALLAALREIEADADNLGELVAPLQAGARAALVHVGAAAVDPVLELLRAGPASARAFAADVLGELPHRGEHVLPALAVALTDRDMAVRSQAQWALDRWRIDARRAEHVAHSEEEAFLLEILEKPLYDAARLVYADWLDDRGAPHGELLRLLTRLAALPADDKDRDELEARAAELRRVCAPGWAALVMFLVSG
jgi:uncharacterized protein (TIGR02996 family)